MNSISEWFGKFWSAVFPADPSQSWANYGVVGDWVGGVLGTLLTGLSLIALFYTLKINRAAMTRQGIHSIFAVMSKTHDDLTSAFRIAELEGAESFRIMLSDFNRCMRATVKHYPDLKVRECIDVAYTAFFYGPTITGRQSVSSTYDTVKIAEIFDEISKLRDKLIKRYPDRKNHRFSGNQARLSNYYRNLYAIYTFIDDSALPLKEKKSILKTIRTKMNNHEQALLSLNICSHLGSSWEKHELIERYEPIKNIPQAFLSLPQDLTIDALYPEVRFEFEDRQQNRSHIYHLELYSFSIAIKVKQRTWHYNFKKALADLFKSWGFRKA